jgi:hypothetical protein
MDKEIVKIKTETKQTFRSKSTNKTYDSKETFLQHHKEDDLAVDTTVTVTNEGIRLITESNESKIIYASSTWWYRITVCNI